MQLGGTANKVPFPGSLAPDFTRFDGGGAGPALLAQGPGYGPGGGFPTLSPPPVPIGVCPPPKKGGSGGSGTGTKGKGKCAPGGGGGGSCPEPASLFCFPPVSRGSTGATEVSHEILSGLPITADDALCGVLRRAFADLLAPSMAA